MRGIGCICVLAAGLATAGCGATSRLGAHHARPHVLALHVALTHPGEVQPFATEVRRRSRGALRVRVVPTARDTPGTAPEQALVRRMRAGRLEFAAVGAHAFGGSMRALLAPMLIDSYALQRRALRSQAARAMLDALAAHGLAGVGFVPGPLRRPVAVDGDPADPAFFAGRTIGIQASAVAGTTMRALGARPVPQPIHPTTAGIDGLEIHMTAVDAFHLDRRGMRVAANVALWPRPLVIVAGARAFRRLSPAERRTLRESAVATAARAARAAAAADAEAAGNLCRRGRAAFGVARPVQIAAMRRAVEPVYRLLGRDAATQRALTALLALKRGLHAPADRLPACHREPVAPPRRVRTVMDGTWVMDTVRRDAGPDFLAENWGHWIFVFDRGRFADTQENAQACTWGYGTYTVGGDHLRLLFAGGGGIAPADAANKPGEAFAFSVSAYRGTLTLRPVKGAISPRNFRVHPWQRLGEPTRSRFSRRCPPPAQALG